MLRRTERDGLSNISQHMTHSVTLSQSGQGSNKILHDISGQNPHLLPTAMTGHVGMVVIFINTLDLFDIHYCQSRTNTFSSGCHLYNLSQLFPISTYAKYAIMHDKFSLCRHAVYSTVFNRHLAGYFWLKLAKHSLSKL